MGFKDRSAHRRRDASDPEQWHEIGRKIYHADGETAQGDVTIAGDEPERTCVNVLMNLTKIEYPKGDVGSQ